MKITVRLDIDFNRLHDQAELLKKLSDMLKRKHSYLLDGVLDLVEEIREQAVDENSIPPTTVFLSCKPLPSSEVCSS